MPPESNRNTIIFIVSAMVILVVYQMLVLEPAQKRRMAELKAKQAITSELAKTAPASVLGPDGRPVAVRVGRDAALAQSPRVRIETPSLSGSLALRGARIDDLYLKAFGQTAAKGSPPVELLRPEGTDQAWFADFGWAGQAISDLPGPDTLWTLASGSRLTPTDPIVLTYRSAQGLTFTRTLKVDDQFLFTIEDRVGNGASAPVTLAAYASVQRQGLPADIGKNGVVHEGAVGALGPAGQQSLKLVKYHDWKKKAEQSFTSIGGWLGVTDKYWLAAVIPEQKESVNVRFRSVTLSGLDLYQTDFSGPSVTISPGGEATQMTRFFAGAKVVPVLVNYQKALGIPRFDSAVDWGMFWFITRPAFQLLEVFYKFANNFGLAILMLTVVVRLVLFPLANKSYESISKMKKLQPQLEALKVKYKDDVAGQQQAMMKIYAEEKINPLMGCLPVLLQIPIFFSVYKVLSVTIEMRHAPFFGWIRDLSARDPTSVFTLFGLVPWDVATTPLIGGFLNGPLHLGVLPLLYGVTMWLTTAMNPPAPDPIQQRMFQLMPILFTFIMAPFAVGLLIYWSWSNVLSILQQYVIMRRYKVDNPIDDILARLRGGTKVAT